MALNLQSLSQALLQLSDAIAYANSDMAKQDHGLFKQFRNSVIQCFEFSYELSWRMIKRQLVLEVPSPAKLDELNFNDLMREAAVRGLIDRPVQWMQYRKERNITSYTYDEKLADEVYQIALAFQADAEQLLSRLKARNP